MDTRKPSKGHKQYKKYQKHRSGEGKNFNFYERVKGERNIIEEGEFFVVVKNIFAYEIWDGYEVCDHLLVTPKQFTDTISSFSKEEMLECMEILQKYELQGFSIYARSPKNKRKTVKHQHTHLIKLDYSKNVNWLFNVAGKILWWR